MTRNRLDGYHPDQGLGLTPRQDRAARMIGVCLLVAAVAAAVVLGVAWGIWE